ncbi:MAG TPA: TIGR00725 family protein [Cyclobacteriaceae bacterium]|nr:TIGR00725 family protein [Cyclobacteriaceae bacterium]
MSVKTIIGVMGPGESATPDDNELAFELGRGIAKNGWVLLTGGRNFGVMEAALKGARDTNGLTIAILPGENDKEASENAMIRIATGMGSGRNIINALSSKIIVVVGMAAGTASEVAHALKAGRKVILLNQDEITIRFFKNVGGYKVMIAKTVEETLAMIKDYLSVHAHS